MKKLLILLTAFITLLVSCEKKELIEPQPQGYYMEAKGDLNFKAIPTTVTASYYTDNGDFMILQGKNTEKEYFYIRVNLKNYTSGSGTYTQEVVYFTFGITDSQDLIIDQWSTEAINGLTGKLTIIQEDHKQVKGTFEFDPFHSLGNLTKYNTSMFIKKGIFNAKKI